eukprot:TRINITY_DN26727_c0_g1_i3.p1 TRINITY_DN26727_c0_g1~~TRINITY_DN26727_c0_g1_i3.p1  ORF type:complete len:314 (+),score=9.09 TRINITY_DN26727_c0_g1_i3:70-1011(+)
MLRHLRDAAAIPVLLLLCSFNFALAVVSWLRNWVVPSLCRVGSQMPQWKPLGRDGVISVIIPCLNEEKSIAETIRSCVTSAKVSALIEILVVVSVETTDSTAAEAEAEANRLNARLRVLHSGSGRGAPLRYGVENAVGDVFVFLHADVILPPFWDQSLRGAFASQKLVAGSFRFGVANPERESCTALQHVALAVTYVLYGWRVRLLGCMEGDHAPFALKGFYLAMGGHPDWPLLEDVEFQRRAWQLSAKRGGEIKVLPFQTFCDPRRWLNKGVLRTTFTNTLVYTAHWMFGVSPNRLYHWYYGRRFVSTPPRP